MSFISFLFVDSVGSLDRKQSHVVPVGLSYKHRLLWVQGQTWARVTLLEMIAKEDLLYQTEDYSNYSSYLIFERP